MGELLNNDKDEQTIMDKLTLDIRNFLLDHGQQSG